MMLWKQLHNIVYLSDADSFENDAEILIEVDDDLCDFEVSIDENRITLIVKD